MAFPPRVTYAWEASAPRRPLGVPMSTVIQAPLAEEIVGVRKGVVSHRRTILAGIAGNIMEWYDFAVYGYFAPVIGRKFFPSDDPSVSLIAAFGVFAAGFLMRPIGG